MKRRTIGKKGFFIQDCCEEVNFYPIKGLISGKEYEILGETDTFFGLHFIIKEDSNKERIISKSCMIISTNQVFIAKSNGKPHIYVENLIKVLKISKTRITSKLKEIFPIFIEQITKKLYKVICSHGNIYYIMDKYVIDKPYGYVGKSFDKVPEVGSNFKFRSVLPFLWNYEKTKFREKWVYIDEIYSIEVIGESFFKIVGKVMHKIGYGYVITAYVSL